MGSVLSFTISKKEDRAVKEFKETVKRIASNDHFIGDLIGVVCIFTMLCMALWIAAGFVG